MVEQYDSNDSELLYGLLKKNNLFSNLSDRQIKELLSIAQLVSYPSGEMIIHENDSSDSLFIIIEGEVEVLKTIKPQSFVRISTLSEGEVIGEIGMFDSTPRSASIRTITPCKLFTIHVNSIKNLDDEHAIYQEICEKLSSVIKEIQTAKHEPSTYVAFVANLASMLSRRVRQTNDVAVDALQKELEHSKARIATGHFLIDIFILLIVYMYSYSFIEKMAKSQLSTTFISIPVILVIAGVVLLMMKQSGYPLKFYGLTLENWKKSAWESIVASILMIVAIGFIKWMIITYIPAYQHMSLIQLGADIHPGGQSESVQHLLTTSSLILLMLGYLIFIPIQELLCRGAIQSSLQEFLIGPHHVFWSILLSNLLFSVVHLHVSFSLAIGVTAPGMVWGWLYYRHKTLVGVSISHFIVAGTAFFVFDIRGILTF